MTILALVAALVADPGCKDACWSAYGDCVERAYEQYLEDNDSDVLIQSYDACHDQLEDCFDRCDLLDMLDNLRDTVPLVPIVPGVTDWWTYW